MTTYLLDANIFIQAKNLHYGIDFCPAFWDWLLKNNEKGVVSSVEKVGDELEAGDDELSIWAKDASEKFFIKPTNSIFKHLSSVAKWANSNGFDQSAVSIFLQSADYWLICQALENKSIVVTHEVPSTSVKRIKIPVVCLAHNVKCITPYEMLRKEKAKFVLGG